MKRSRGTIWIIGFLMAMTAFIAAVRLMTRQQEQEHAVQVICNKEALAISLDDLPMDSIHGVMVTGKGEQREINGAGISVAGLLEQADVEPADVREVQVTASDEYTVSLTAEEVMAEGKACLFLDDGTMRLIVFGDENSKRNVKNVVRVTVISSQEG